MMLLSKVEIDTYDVYVSTYSNAMPSAPGVRQGCRCVDQHLVCIWAIGLGQTLSNVLTCSGCFYIHRKRQVRVKQQMKLQQ